MKLFQIDPFAHADGPPPKTLAAFFRWALAGSGSVLLFASALSVIGGVAEVGAAILLGRVIDSALASSPDAIFSQNALLLVGCLLFFTLFRPVVMGLEAARAGTPRADFDASSSQRP